MLVKCKHHSRNQEIHIRKITCRKLHAHMYFKVKDIQISQLTINYTQICLQIKFISSPQYHDKRFNLVAMFDLHDGIHFQLL